MMGSGRKENLQASSPQKRGAASGRRPRIGSRLLADAELVDDRAVALEVRLLEVVQKAAATPDQLQEAATAVMVLRVRLEVLRQIGNSAREECDLHFWGAGIAVMRAILGNEICF